MTILRYTLLSDGSSDAALIPIIEWLIAQHRPEIGVLGQCAQHLETTDLSLASRVPAALAKYPCELLFIHRDAEAVPLTDRLQEIDAASVRATVPCVPVIPVRMTEAWLFSDETAIRSAAENRNGVIKLQIPSKKMWEGLVDPKACLFGILVLASGKQGRALAKFNPHRQRALVTQRTDDFSRLRGLPSFDFFEAQLVRILKDF